MFDWLLLFCLIVTDVLNNITSIFITSAFKKGIDEFVCNLSHLVFLEHFWYFFLFISHQNTYASLEFSVMNSTISGPSTFMYSNVSTFSSFNLLCQSLFTTFIKLKDLSMISLEYGVDKQNSIIRNIWGNFSPVHWYKVDHVLDVQYFFAP